jgi:hypothetical protein
MKAKTMFKKLDFVCYVDERNNNNIIYRNELYEDHYDLIVFCRDTKEIKLRSVDNEFVLNIKGVVVRPESKNFVLTYDLLQAINKQVKELKWKDETN